MTDHEREQAELLWWCMMQACARRNIAPPNERVKATMLPVIMDGLRQIGGPMGQASVELAKLLVTEPVEANGILSRIETHLAQLRDFLHGAMREPVDGASFPGLVILHELRRITESIQAQSEADIFNSASAARIADEQNQALLREVRSIADHDAQIMAARHEFMRDALVAVGNDVLAIKAMVKAMDERLQAVEAKRHGGTVGS